jgi:DNA invertase Pin-like site-specific DNA recombinase
MSKITTEHLARSAYVYIRQSTADQLTHNHESRRRQYGLANRARQLGWASVEVIDDDLGRSGGGVARPGFERLLAAICEARVGAVLAIEASRLARNGRDWHTLSSSVDWSGPSSSTRTASTILAIRMIGCCLG